MAARRKPGLSRIKPLHPGYRLPLFIHIDDILIGHDRKMTGLSLRKQLARLEQKKQLA